MKSLIILLLAATAMLVSPTSAQENTSSKSFPERVLYDCDEPVVFRYMGKTYALNYLEWKQANRQDPNTLVRLPDGLYLDIKKWEHSNPLGVPYNTKVYKGVPKGRLSIDAKSWVYRPRF